MIFDESFLYHTIKQKKLIDKDNMEEFEYLEEMRLIELKSV